MPARAEFLAPRKIFERQGATDAGPLSVRRVEMVCETGGIARSWGVASLGCNLTLVTIMLE